ncbi:hypothetical protein VP01_12471g1, partial [Puccinia sorghi]
IVLLGTQMKTTARRQLTLPSSGLSSEELIGTIPPLLSISKKGFRAASPALTGALRYKKKFPSKASTPSASTLAPRSKISTKIASRETGGHCLYCGGKHELDSHVKRIAREAAKLAKK